MGIDFSNLIKNLGAAAAGMSGKTDKIDSKHELKSFVSGWDQIKADAKADANKSGIVDLQANAQTQAEIDALAKAELNEIMGLDFAKKDIGIQKKIDVQKGAVFSDEDISLENLMSLLGDDVDASRVAEHSKKPMLSSASESVDELTNAGFDHELLSELIDVEPGAIKYMSNAIKDGSAARIADETAQMEKDVKATKEILAEMLKNDIKSMSPKWELD